MPASPPRRIEVTPTHLLRDGVPWFPVTGEIHYSRIPRARWDEVLGHARAGGLTTVATYVFWQAHEPTRGDFRWDDNLDLRAFIQAAANQGLEVIVRLGPWAHGEARHGGFPDWLLDLPLVPRTDDPAYLALVTILYAQIIDQLHGLTHGEGGPVVGVQVDNELYDQPGHLATLRTIAEELGLHVPLWTATGWGGAQLPENLLPVYSAYVDGFWEDSVTPWPAFAATHFRYSTVRDDLGVGADLRAALDASTADGTVAEEHRFPFATCELGGGMHVAYHRRPLVTARDVAALAKAKLGSGSIWQGYYMYAGGTMRVGPHGTEQESQATNYPNDVPTRSYDFFAPIGEFGQIRPHHHLLRRQHLWLAADGAALAAMPVHIGGGSDDPEELRWAVRGDGRRGYLFLTTYQVGRYPLAPQPGVQITVDFDDATVTVPHRPVDLPAGVSVAWPLRYPLTDDLTLRSATAELLTRFDGGEPLVVFVATDGVAPEFVFDGSPAVDGPVTAEAVDGGVRLRPTVAPGAGCRFDVDGVTLLVLDEAAADQAYRLPVAGRDRLILSEVPVRATPDGLVAHGEQASFRLAVWPPTAPPRSPAAIALEPADWWSSWQVRQADAGHSSITVDSSPVVAEPYRPRPGGPLGRLSAPTDFSGAGRVQVTIPAEALDAPTTLLRIAWSGDVGRCLVGDEVISDHFWHGRVWDICLSDHRDAILAAGGVTLELFGWDPAAGVWVDPSVRDAPPGVTLRSIDLIQVSRIPLTFHPSQEKESC